MLGHCGTRTTLAPACQRQTKHQKVLAEVPYPIAPDYVRSCATCGQSAHFQCVRSALCGAVQCMGVQTDSPQSKQACFGREVHKASARHPSVAFSENRQVLHASCMPMPHDSCVHCSSGRDCTYVRPHHVCTPACTQGHAVCTGNSVSPAGYVSAGPPDLHASAAHLNHNSHGI